MSKIKSQYNNYDTIVIGGGHAGIEAAYLSAKMGAKTLLVTLEKSKIGAMHCNPSVGGLGKGHLVFELAALGGLMPQLCSKTYLQARMLNTSKGPAVQGLRLQIDKIAYAKLAQEVLSEIENLTILEGEVDEILTNAKGELKAISGVIMASGQTILTKSLVLCTGTFLQSRILVGKEETIDPAKVFKNSCKKLALSLEKCGPFELSRLKTGTPPRLLKSSLNYSNMQKQVNTDPDFLFDFWPVKIEQKVDCFITATNEKTHDLISKNFSQSALFDGQIVSKGPRYCPSIEIKVFRFGHRNSHQIFVEQESLESDLIYPAGMSNAFAPEFQLELLKTIAGFEDVVMVRPGFQIEYDFVQPTQLEPTLQTKKVSGLFFAGQINGTTGYEEAAAQGAVAGINAALLSAGKPLRLWPRSNSYIGVMINDLTAVGVDEPYRMFTSRAERRLLLRQDNAFARLTPIANELGLIDKQMYQAFNDEQGFVNQAWSLIDKTKLSKNSLFKEFDHSELTQEAKDALWNKLCQELSIDQEGVLFCPMRAIAQLYAQVRYDGYLEREEQDAVKLEKYMSINLPINNDEFYRISGLSAELQQKLILHKPTTIGQAMQIPGMTPAAATILAIMS